jgi:hypothetical protein
VPCEQNDGGNISAQSAPPGSTYTVSSDGRVTFAGGGCNTPILYLVGANKGFVLFTDGAVVPTSNPAFSSRKPGAPSRTHPRTAPMRSGRISRRIPVLT